MDIARDGQTIRVSYVRFKCFGNYHMGRGADQGWPKYKIQQPTSEDSNLMRT